MRDLNFNIHINDHVYRDISLAAIERSSWSPLRGNVIRVFIGVVNISVSFQQRRRRRRACLTFTARFPFLKTFPNYCFASQWSVCRMWGACACPVVIDT